MPLPILPIIATTAARALTSRAVFTGFGYAIGQYGNRNRSYKRSRFIPSTMPYGYYPNRRYSYSRRYPTRRAFYGRRSFRRYRPNYYRRRYY